MSKGIYKITNLINNKSYIGKSSNIEERWRYHKSNYNNSKEYNKILYEAFRKYGIENFSFEIIELLENEYDIKSNEREQYWIDYFNSFHFGYNMTEGGDGGLTCDMRKKFGKLTEQDVIYIRQQYNKCISPRAEIYKEFANRISERGFEAIWLGQNWKDILPEVYTTENKKKHLLIERQRQGILRRRLSLDKINEIRNRVNNGENLKEIFNKEFINIYKWGGFRDVIQNKHPDENA